MSLLRKILSLALVCLTIVSASTTTRAQQRILWQGAVKPEEMNVYTSASTKDRVTTTLKRGEVVDVVLEINAMGDAWCRIAFSGQSEPLGYVLCLHLEQGHFAPKQSAHNESVATQSHAQAPATSTTPKPTIASVVNPTELTNKDILDMNKTGLPPEILVAKIKSSQCNFDTSPAALQALKSAGIADKVILAMVEAPVGEPKASGAAGPPSVADTSTHPTPANALSDGKTVFPTTSAVQETKPPNSATERAMGVAMAQDTKNITCADYESSAVLWADQNMQGVMQGGEIEEIKCGEAVAVLSGPSKNFAQTIRVRTKDGREGYVPGRFLGFASVTPPPTQELGASVAQGQTRTRTPIGNVDYTTRTVGYAVKATLDIQNIMIDPT